MDTRSEILKYLKGSKESFAARYGVSRIGLFGSAARDELLPGSDVDVIVDFASPAFDEYMDLKFELEGAIGRPVDLVVSGSVKKRLAPLIASQTVYA